MSDESIIAVFPLSKEHLIDIIPLADKFDLFENSRPELFNGRRRPIHCLSQSLGKITYENPQMPAHVRLIVDIVKDPTLGKGHLHSLDTELDTSVISELKRSSQGGPTI